MRGVHVDSPGLLTTIQDSGRWGYQAFGVPVSGPMDWWSHRAANALVGNDVTAAALEVTITGPTITAHTRVTVAITGAAFELRVASREMISPTLFILDRGETLRFGARAAGCRSYVAFAGGIDVPPVLGSRSTDLRSGLGGMLGRAIRAGDTLPVAETADAPASWPPVSTRALPPQASSPTVLRFVPDDELRGTTIDRFSECVLNVSSQSNRAGYRFHGSPAIGMGDARRLSRPAVMGLVQLPPSGGPILLMADAQPTGGYPILGVVITADLPLAGQLAPGDAVRFAACTRDEALAALADRERALPRTEARP